MVKMLLLILISFAPKFTLQSRVQMNYDKFNTIAGMPATTATYTRASTVSSSPGFPSSWQPTATFVSQQQQQQQQVTAWAPAAMANDWYILQAATNAAAVSEVAAAEVAEATYSANQQLQKQQRQQHRRRAIAPLNNYEGQQMAIMEGQGQQQQPQLPLTYYAYNGSSNSGNYHSPTKDMRVMKPFVLPLSHQESSEFTIGGMHKKQQDIGKSSRNNNNNNSNNKNDKGNTNHNNRANIKIYNNNNSFHSQSQQNEQYVEHKTPTINNVNNGDSIIAQPQHTILFGWQDIESKIIANVRGVGNAKAPKARDKSDDEKRADTEHHVTVETFGSVDMPFSNSLADLKFNEILLPLGNILDKVTQFCVALKQIINEDEEDLASIQLITSSESDEAFANTASATAEHAANIMQISDVITTAGDTAQLLAEVQGQRSIPNVPPTSQHATNTQQSPPSKMVMAPLLTAPRSSAITASKRAATTNANTTQQTAKSFTSTSLGIRQGKKLKKKLKKLILPLLLAYKLKFIALVPLLIGGLVLLVGSTGMAGFFFALFLTVMTLKSTVNKSIVIKKDW